MESPHLQKGDPKAKHLTQKIESNKLKKVGYKNKTKSPDDPAKTEETQRLYTQGVTRHSWGNQHR